jgi:hypothetical protein
MIADRRGTLGRAAAYASAANVWGHPAFLSGHARLVTAELVSRPCGVRRATTFACDLLDAITVHCRKSSSAWTALL